MKISRLLALLAICCLGISAKAQLGQSKFIDPANMDMSVKPGDDFYTYASGNWLRKNPVPAKETRWGSFNQLRDFNANAVKGLVETAAADKAALPGSISKRVGDFYKAAMDSIAIEKAGIKPIQADLAKIDKLTNISQLPATIVYMQSNSIGNPLYSFSIGQDRKNVNNMIVYLGQGGISLPDRDDYFSNDQRSVNIRDAYKKYITKLFTLAGNKESDAAAKADVIFEVEKQLADKMLTRVEMRDANKVYNKFSLNELTKKTPGFNWKQIFALAGASKQDSTVVNNPAFFEALSNIVNDVSLADWKTYLQWNVLKDAAPHLSSAFANANFEYNKVISGQKVQTPRWQRTTSLVDGSIGDLLGQLYVQKYFKPEAKQRMDEMIKNLRKAFEIRIKNLSWMSNETKQKALAKLAAFTPKIGHTTNWEKYVGLNISSTNHFQNLRNVAQWRYKNNIDKLGKPVDKTRFGMTPPTVNAYYNATMNEIVFPAGILQFPFFSKDADDALNYGGIGAVIGHEMSHGFDDQGSKYDADGTLRNWWTDADRKAFDELTAKLAAQYDAYTVNDTIHVNGKFTLGENIGDLGGLNAALEAFKMTKEYKGGEVIDGFTPLQRFFLAWAQVWRSNTLPQTAANLIKTDPHSPGTARTIGPIVNMDEWYDAFNVQPGDKLYVAPEHRLKIW